MKNKYIPRTYSILLILSPLVVCFDIFIITPMLLLCIVEFMLACVWITKGNKLIFDVNALPYLGYLVLSIVISICLHEGGNIYSIVVRLLYNILLFFVFYVCYWQVFDYNFAIKCYVSVSIILSILMIVQFFLAIVGKGVCLLPAGIPVTSSSDLTITTDFARNNQIALQRYSTIFLEPAHQAAYMLPCLVIVLFRNDIIKRIDFAISVLLTAGIFCTTSSIGILGSITVWSFFFLRLIISGSIRRSWWIMALFPIMILIFFNLLSKENIASNITNRLQILNVHNRGRTEGFRRIRYGWLCFGKLDFIHKLFGLGYKNFGHYLIDSGIGFDLLGVRDLPVVSYANGITSMLLGIGLCGGFLNLNLYLWRALRSRDFYVYALLIVWGILMFASASFDELSSLTVIVFILYLVKNKGHYVEIKL